MVWKCRVQTSILKKSCWVDDDEDCSQATTYCMYVYIYIFIQIYYIGFGEGGIFVAIRESLLHKSQGWIDFFLMASFNLCATQWPHLQVRDFDQGTNQGGVAIFISVGERSFKGKERREWEESDGCSKNRWTSTDTHTQYIYIINYIDTCTYKYNIHIHIHIRIIYIYMYPSMWLLKKLAHFSAKESITTYASVFTHFPFLWCMDQYPTHLPLFGEVLFC